MGQRSLKKQLFGLDSGKKRRRHRVSNTPKFWGKYKLTVTKTPKSA